MEGLSLAIELAAARANVLTPAQMLARLSRPKGALWAMLVSDRRDRSTRHRTLRAAIEWSYQLLSPELQHFFARLSVFRGGWTLEAAEAMAGRFSGSDDALPDALAMLDRLQKSSLIVAEKAAAAMRYRLLELLREFAAEQLTPAEQAELSLWHAGYFAQLAEKTEAARSHGEPHAWAERLAQEQDNLRAALSWALAAVNHSPLSPAVDLGVRLAAALWWFWPYKGRLREGREWLDQARRCGGPAAAQTRPRLLLGSGLLALQQGDNPSAQDFCEASLPLFQEADDRVGMAQTLYQLGWVAHNRGDLDRARKLWEESLALRRQLGLKVDIVQSLRHLKWLAADLKDPAAARGFYGEELALMRQFGGAAAAAAQLIREVVAAHEQGNHSAVRLICAEALALWREFGNSQEIAETLDYLGVIARGMGEYELARTVWEQSLAINRALGLEYNVHLSLWNLAQVARLAGDLTAVRARTEESLRIAREMGSKEPIAHALDELRFIAWKQGDWNTPLALPRESLTFWLELGNLWGLAEAPEGEAHVAVVRDDAARAARLFGAAERLRERIGRPRHPHERPDYEQSVAAARTALGEAALATAWATGRELSPQQAVADALET